MSVLPAEQPATPDRPVWAHRIREYRLARGWSQAQAVRVLQAHGSVGELPDFDNLLSNWKRWEAGRVEPTYYKPLIAKVFGTVVAAIFPQAPTGNADLFTVAGMDTLEVLARLRISDVSAATLEALEITANRLCCQYSRSPAEPLHTESVEWLERLTGLLDRRLTLAQHRDILAIAGRVALLVGCLEYDLGRYEAAESTRTAALSLGGESGDADTVGWAHEMRAWYALTQGHYRAALAATQAGIGAAGENCGVAVQLLAHQAKAWARVGDRRQVDVALDRGRAILDVLPYPDNLDNHFVVDPSKWDFYTLDCYRHIGEDRLAETYALEVLRSSTDASGTDRKPMRSAEAWVTLGVVAARRGNLEQALSYGRHAVDNQRRSLPSLLMCMRELGGVLTDQYPGEDEVDLFLDGIRMLAKSTTT